jgi:hypothetical protein
MLYGQFRQEDYYLLKDHFYRPFTDPSKLDPDYWTRQRELVGVAVNADRALAFLRDAVIPFLGEFRASFPLHQTAGSATEFWLVNGTYMAVDAHVYYGIIRRFRPSRIFEVGSGRSTILAAEAVRRNLVEGAACRLVAIEPYPELIHAAGLSDFAEVMPEKVENVGLEVFESLSENDVLFIDSSHALKEGGDVQFLYNEVLPRLKAGVLVHVHDISLPRPYPRVYFEAGWFWNEQYLLQSLLTYNSRVDIVWPGNYVMCKEPDYIHDVFPEIAAMRAVFPSAEPTAFWYRTR